MKEFLIKDCPECTEYDGSLYLTLVTYNRYSGKKEYAVAERCNYCSYFKHVSDIFHDKEDAEEFYEKYLLKKEEENKIDKVKIIEAKKTELMKKLMEDIAKGKRYSCPNCGEKWPKFGFLEENIVENLYTNDLYVQFHCKACSISLRVTYKPWEVDFYQIKS